MLRQSISRQIRSNSTVYHITVYCTTIATSWLMAFSKSRFISTRIAQISEWREESLKIREIRSFARFAFQSLGFVK